MKSQSAKAKGRRFQQWVRDIIISYLDLTEDDVHSRSMGAQGEDIMLSSAARQKFPYSIECKNQEKINIWKSYEQSKANCGNFEPIVFFTRNRGPKLVIVDAEYFIDMHRTKSGD